MTTENQNFWTHTTGAGAAPHQWRYLGKVAQAYHCVVCDLRVSKAKLKRETDA